MSEPELYDTDSALAEIAKARLRRDVLTRTQADLGDRLAAHLNRHFAAEELETAGRALMVAAGGSGALAEMKHMSPAVIVNIIGFAAARLIEDGRAWQPASAEATS